MSTKLTRVGAWSAASEATSERSHSSLLPAPVVPAISPWGPSATRSRSSGPSSDRANRATSSVPGCVADQRARSSSPSGAPIPISPDSATNGGSEPPGSARSASSKRARASAQVRAVAGDTPATSSGSTRWPSWGRASAASPASSSSSTTVVHAAGRRSAVRAITIPQTFSPARSRARPAAPRPSISCGMSRIASVVRASSGSRSDSSAASAVAAGPPTASSRPEPLPSRRACGSHLIQSQSAPAESSVRPAITRSAGPCRTAAWQTRARASASAWGRSPTMPTTPPPERSTSIGASSIQPCSASTCSASSASVVRSVSCGRKGTSP